MLWEGAAFTSLSITSREHRQLRFHALFQFPHPKLQKHSLKSHEGQMKATLEPCPVRLLR